MTNVEKKFWILNICDYLCKKSIILTTKLNLL